MRTRDRAPRGPGEPARSSLRGRGVAPVWVIGRRLGLRQDQALGCEVVFECPRGIIV